MVNKIGQYSRIKPGSPVMTDAPLGKLNPPYLPNLHLHCHSV